MSGYRYAGEDEAGNVFEVVTSPHTVELNLTGDDGVALPTILSLLPTQARALAIALIEASEEAEVQGMSTGT